MTQRFERAYDALYNAFMNNTLAKGNCKACAIGNIVAYSMGTPVTSDYTCSLDNTFWNTIFYTPSGGNQVITRHPVYEEQLKALTEYSWEELAKIEYAFERAAKIHYERYSAFTAKEIIEDQFNGLMAAMDVMIKLDEVKEGNTYKESFKDKFQTA